MLNVFVTPAEVFDQVATSPTQPANWRVPTLLVTLATILLIQLRGQPPVPPFAPVSMDPHLFAGGWPIVSALTVCAAAFCGTFWAAMVLWLISRFFLKVNVPFLKAAEVVGLSATILLLGSVFTGLLMLASGDGNARPSLALLAGDQISGQALALLDTFNFFHLWATTVLAVGLSRLSGTTFRETAFWVFGFWLVLRLALILLI